MAKEVTNYSALGAEFIATFTLTIAVLASTGSGFSLAGPFALAIMVAIIGPISGGHVNPAITFGLWTTRRIKGAVAAQYMIAQAVGALLAIVAARIAEVLPSQFTVAQNFTDSFSRTFSLEALGMVLFGFGVAAVFSQKKQGLEAGALVGGSLMLGLLFASLFGYSAMLNPAVALSSTSFSWVYIVGPFFGSAVGFMLYDQLANSPKKK
ncbi:hypothetical protein A3F37_00375 [Candidatus Saccharibacteria bacterium RIFCSPHIGHO2_12_FULL_41_12]|nr:MAG: hypothetical protein A3F37_00375 [Candidatus Saccharibacteria bacterium RIFCSPHIGHO2_12_FULL_41_12]